MLAPKDTDIPTLFLVFIVLPLVTYFILGKWSEATKRKERISLIAKRAADEALRVEDMAVGSVIPMASVPNDGFHHCARCFGTATTRCAKCKSVWYCSGRCQITHWRQVHKLECQQLGNSCQILSPKPISREGSRRVSSDETVDPNLFEHNMIQPTLAKTSSTDVISNPLTIYGTASGVTMDTSGKHVTRIPYRCLNGDIARESTVQESIIVERQSVNGSDNVYRDGNLNSSTMGINGTNVCDGQMDLIDGEYISEKGSTYYDETKCLNFSPGKTSMKRISKTRTVSHSHGVKPQKSPKLGAKISKDNAEESSVATTKDNIPLQESNRITSLGITRMMGLTKSTKLDHQQHSEDVAKKLNKLKMLFPYEEFVKCFQFEVLNVSPRGLVNCGNSCYANAVLQCLTSTKPLIIYLLRQSHSRTGCAKDWCLMCELERHVMMLRESGCPLSPGNILMHIRSLNSQIGDGSQEDAHEFLRLIVTSMQSICLERLGGENVVAPRLQDTTFVQHTFGGRLRSKVKCLRCHHESERYENIMDLTLEIFGWVESLQDALTQFTSSEDLDGENMYRCGRCASYVRARKQLSIQEAPNILTIVLKRFQEGNYGKINKCITFPEMLDMIPFMTGTDDVPPLYMLYAVVVHLDTSNASFSGHYISYVKDLQGNWFKIDDTQVQPVQLSQVMSQGAYILFYMRSYPRPARGYSKKATCHRSPDLPKHFASKTEKSSKPEQRKLNQNFIGREPSLDCRLDTNIDHTDNSRGIFMRENRSRPPITKNYAEFSDATSSDWSLFTSSDDASFTTESTRDSFSAVDYADAVPFSSIFQSLYPAESTTRRTISCSVFPSSMPHTRFAHEEKGFVSCIPGTTTSSDWEMDSIRQASGLSTIGLHNDYSHGTVHLNYGSDPRNGSPYQTYDHC